MAVILDRRAATRGVDHHRIQTTRPLFRHPCVDIRCRRGMRLIRLAHMMRQRPAAAHALGHHDLAAQSLQNADRRIIDIGVQRLLRATRHQRHAHLGLALGRKALRIIIATDRGNSFRGHRKHCAQPRIRHQKGKGPPDFRPQKRQTKPRRMRDDLRQNPTQGAVREGPLVGFLDVFPRVIHQMHVMHARGAGRHAGQTTQAAINMLNGLFIRRAVVLQHILDQIDPPARAVQLIPQDLIGRASRGTKAAMHAGPQNLVRPLDRGVFQLFGRKMGLHVLSCRHEANLGVRPTWVG